MAFRDSALLHVFIGFSDLFKANNNKMYSTSVDYCDRWCLGMRHLNEAISIVNKRASDVQNESLATIAII